MEDLVDEVIDSAKDAYSFAKENNLEKPLIEVSKKFIQWFGGLFTRKAHKEKVSLLEKFEASEKDLTMLKSELQAQLEENENLKSEFEEKIASLKAEVSSSNQQESINIIRSKNVIAGVKRIDVKGNFRMGDDYTAK